MEPGSTDPADIAATESWQQIFRDLSLAYHWTPGQIAELTLAQLRHYLSELATSGTVRMSPEQALRYTVERMQAKNEWVAQLQKRLVGPDNNRRESEHAEQLGGVDNGVQ